jgi:hypothetical protein
LKPRKNAQAYFGGVTATKPNRFITFSIGRRRPPRLLGPLGPLRPARRAYNLDNNSKKTQKTQNFICDFDFKMKL